MSTRLYWSNNARQNINMFNSIQRTNMERLAYFTGYMRKEPDKSNEHVESSITSESGKSGKYASAICPRSSNSTCSVGNYCSNAECPKCRCFNCTCTENGNKDGDNDFDDEHPKRNEYIPTVDELLPTTTTVTDPERERSSTGIWIGNELRAAQQPNTDAADTIEFITGIPTGVTV